MSEPEAKGKRDRWVVPAGLDRAASWSWRVLVVAAALYVVVWLVTILQFVVFAVLVAVIATSAIEPPVRWMHQRGLPRILATWIGVLGVAAALVSLFVAVVPRFVDEFGDVSARVNEAGDDIKEWAQTGPLGLSETQVNDLETDFQARVSDAVDGVLLNPSAGLSVVAEVLTGAVLAIVLTFYFVHDGGSMWRWFVSRIPADDRRAVINKAGFRLMETLRSWLGGMAIAGLFDAIALGIALVIIGVPLVFALSVLAFFAAFVPILGVVVAGGLAVLVALVANGPTDALLVAAVVLGIQQIEGDVIIPMVMSRSVKLHPSVVLVALTAGGIVAGIPGAVVAVPVTAAVVAVITVLSGPDPDSEASPPDPGMSVVTEGG
ncbi:MAG: AI-2E family transporter [Actinomycetota bacterium]